MGAHSGSSSEDFYLLIGLLNENINYLLSYNKEIHGLKSMNFPELKDEYTLSILYKHKKHQNFSINIEREKN